MVRPPRTPAAVAGPRCAAMSDALDFDPQHKDDFDRVYDLDDPRPYYQGLRPSDYRMPEYVAAWLRARRDVVAAARGRSGPLRLLDFGCGFGAIGALLRHEIDMPDLYRHYAGAWRPAEGRANWEPDRAAFAARRRQDSGFEIGGLDLAANALDYARHLGFIDRAFAEDVVTHPPSPALERYLAGVDIVIESGAIGPFLAGAVEHLLRAVPSRSPSWFLYCPRPDVDWVPLDALWEEAGYETAVCMRAPAPYRKPLSDGERDQILHLSAQFGRRPHEAIAAGYIQVEMKLARPRRERERPGLEALRFPDEGR